MVCKRSSFSIVSDVGVGSGRIYKRTCSGQTSNRCGCNQSQEAGSILINEVKNIVITVIAATAVIGGSLSLGMMLAIQYIIGQLNAPVEQFVQFLYSWQDVKISLERMSEIHDREEEETPERMITGFNGSDRDIEIRNVTFQYEGIHSPKVWSG